MAGLLGFVRPTAAERSDARPGDARIAAAVVMDRAFTLGEPPQVVWPWIVQLGKKRAGWYLPRLVERLVPPSRRALRRLDARWSTLHVGDVVPDYGGKSASFEVAEVDPPYTLVYWTKRGPTEATWAITLRPTGTTGTRVHLRLRMGPVKHTRLAESVGGTFDFLTIAGLAAGLRERVESAS